MRKSKKYVQCFNCATVSALERAELDGWFAKKAEGIARAWCSMACLVSFAFNR